MQSFSHRKGKAAFTLKDAQGRPMAGQRVHVELENHEFLFGSGVFWLTPMLDPAAPEKMKAALQQVWEDWKALLNYGTLPFYQGRYEPVEGQTMEAPTLRAARFLKENGFAAKGHPLCWHTVSAPWLRQKTTEQVLENQLFRIRREVGAFKAYIPFWDVINEVVIMPEFSNEAEENAITRLCREMGRVGLVKKVFDQARAMDPQAKLLLNDLNIEVVP